MSPIIAFVKRQPLAMFFVLTFALAGIATFVFARDPVVLPFVLVLIPTLAAVTLAAITEGRAGVQALLRRVGRWRVGPRWYAVALGLSVLGTLAIVVVAVLLGTPSSDLFSTVTPGALLIVAVMLLPAFAEEICWRGYALPRLLVGALRPHSEPNPRPHLGRVSLTPLLAGADVRGPALVAAAGADCRL
jgi:uncharacterized protein